MTRELRPLAKARRHPADYRDELEHAEVVRIMSELPEDHVAVYAYYTAASAASDSISLAHLVTDRMDLVDRLVAAYMANGDRICAKCSGAGRLGR